MTTTRHKTGASAKDAGGMIEGPLGIKIPAQTRDILRRALTANSDWPDTDELLDVVYWGRQVIGLVLGLLWGAVCLYGVIGLALFLIISTLFVHLFVTSYQGVDEDNLGGFWEIAKEGFMSSFATFLVSWIIVYSSLYY